MMFYLSIFFGARILLLQSLTSQRKSSSSCKPSVHLPKWSEPGGTTRSFIRGWKTKRCRISTTNSWLSSKNIEASTNKTWLLPTESEDLGRQNWFFGLDFTFKTILTAWSIPEPPSGPSGQWPNPLVTGRADLQILPLPIRAGVLRQLPGPFYGRFSNFHQSHCKYPGWLSKNYRDLSWLIYWGFLITHINAKPINHLVFYEMG